MSKTTTHQTEISADAEVPLIRITREFDAPAAKVFRAHADPELFARWIGPDGGSMDIDRYDFRSGGAFRYVHTDEHGEYGFFGGFHEVRTDELIVQTFTFEGVPDGVALEKLVFEDLPAGRSRLTSTSLVDTFEGRDAWVASGMESGVQEGHRKLDALLAEGGA